jgi:hypothetical protein
MKRPYLLCILFCLLAATLAAQTEIGGGTCSTATLSGTYAISITGRQVTSAGNYTSVLQGNGSANFDGLSVAKITMTVDSNQSVGAGVTWLGNYTVQSNCAGVVTVTSGGTAVLNLVLYSTGADFLVTGNDGTYSYSGSGNTQPTGYGLASGSVSGALDATGLLQFDGVSSITLNATFSQIGSTAAGSAVTGSYSVSSTCVGSATLTGKGETIMLTLSVTGLTKTNNTDFFVTAAQSGAVLLSGSGHPVFGQPVVSAANRGAGDTRAVAVLATQQSQSETADGRTK